MTKAYINAICAAEASVLSQCSSVRGRMGRFEWQVQRGGLAAVHFGENSLFRVQISEVWQRICDN